MIFSEVSRRIAAASAWRLIGFAVGGSAIVGLLFGGTIGFVCAIWGGAILYAIKRRHEILASNSALETDPNLVPLPRLSAPRHVVFSILIIGYMCIVLFLVGFFPEDSVVLSKATTQGSSWLGGFVPGMREAIDRLPDRERGPIYHGFVHMYFVSYLVFVAWAVWLVFEQVYLKRNVNNLKGNIYIRSLSNTGRAIFLVPVLIVLLPVLLQMYILAPVGGDFGTMEFGLEFITLPVIYQALISGSINTLLELYNNRKYNKNIETEPK